MGGEREGEGGREAFNTTGKNLRNFKPTSSQGQDILDSESLGLEEVGSHLVFGDIGTRDVEHGLQTAVVESCTGYGHRASLLITCETEVTRTNKQSFNIGTIQKAYIRMVEFQTYKKHANPQRLLTKTSLLTTHKQTNEQTCILTVTFNFVT